LFRAKAGDATCGLFRGGSFLHVDCDDGF